MALLDLLGRRWALRVLWELRAGPVPSFRELQSRCGGVSSSVLTDRLAELREAGIVERADDGYRLSARGAELCRGSHADGQVGGGLAAAGLAATTVAESWRTGECVSELWCTSELWCKSAL